MSSIKKESQLTRTNNDGSVKRSVTSYTWSSQNEIAELEVRLAPNVSPPWVPLWDPTVWTGYPIADFEFLSIAVEIVGNDTVTYAAQYIHLQMTVKKGDVNMEMGSRKIKVGQDYHIPTSVAYYNHGVAVDSNAALATIDALDVKNPETDITKPDILVRLVLLDNT